MGSAVPTTFSGIWRPIMAAKKATKKAAPKKAAKKK
jgi:hypothetical protein